jgi:hypothetical protein
MAQKNSKENGCDGKIAYESLRQANHAASSLSEKSRVKKVINGYRCEHCAKYHIGNSRHKKKRKEGYRDKRDKPFNPDDIQTRPGNDKGFYLIKSNLQK